MTPKERYSKRELNRNKLHAKRKRRQEEVQIGLMPMQSLFHESTDQNKVVDRGDGLLVAQYVVHVHGQQSKGLTLRQLLKSLYPDRVFKGDPEYGRIR